MRVELDKRALFALASDTRVEILRSLQPMRRTVTQLAEALDVDKAAVHRHLQKLVEGGLVQRHEDHGFVYYGLTWKARDLLSPNENTKIIVHLSAFLWTVMAAAAAVALAVGSSTISYYYTFTGRDLGTGTTPTTEGPFHWSDFPPSSLTEITNPANPVWPVLAILFTVLAGTLFVIAWRSLRGRRQRPGPGELPEAAAP